MSDRKGCVDNQQQVKFGAILSYLLIVLNSVYSLFITPFILNTIGEVDFGTYKTIASLSTSLAVLDIGLGGTIMRYIARYRADNEEHRIPNFLSMAYVEGVILIGIITIVCSVIYSLLPSLYKNGLNNSQIALAKELFIILSINLALHIIENILYGILAGYNQFTYANGLKFFRVICRILATCLFLTIFRSAKTLVIIDLSLTILLITFEIFFIKRRIRINSFFCKNFWDKNLFQDSFRYTILLFLTSIAAQVNSNLDNVVIGAELGASLVTVYSMGLLIFGMFENISTAISGVMLPTVTFTLSEDLSGERIQNLIIKIGRLQFLLLGAVIAGFTVLGKQFIGLWLGDGFDDIYIIVLLLMYPSLLELCVNVCLSVLRANNQLGFRTSVLCCTTVMNAFITIVFVPSYGYFAAAVGTGLSFFIGSVIVMNFYYYIKYGYHMISIYIQIFKGILPCILIATVITYFSSRFIYEGLIAFLTNVLIFIIVYGFSLVFIGLSKSEIQSIPILNKVKELKI